MPPLPSTMPVPPRTRLAGARGSVLITALLLAAAIALGLAGYISLSRNSLSLAHRTFFANDATNLAEAGLEEAIYCYNQMSAGTATATAWTGWTLSGANAMRTLTPFNRDQNALGTVKVYVRGYDGSNSTPYAISQATITPFDGSAPIVKLLQIGLKQSGLFTNGIVGLGGLNLSGNASIDSFNSNPANSPTGPWATYSSANAASNSTVIVPSGTIALGKAIIKGNLSVGSGVTAPPASQVTGTIQTNYSGTFAMPTYPIAAKVSQSYNLGKTLPATLPAAGDKTAADGRYYYFVSGATIGNTTIAAGKNVTIVGSTTSLGSGLKVGASATCAIYIDGAISASGNGALTNSSWAGALQVFTTTTSNCAISGNGDLRACVYAPNAKLTASGNGAIVGSFVAKSITASGNASFHYDEALRQLNTGGGNSWGIATWFERQSSGDRSAVGALTANFLP